MSRPGRLPGLVRFVPRRPDEMVAWMAFLALALSPPVVLGGEWAWAAVSGEVELLPRTLNSPRTVQLLANSYILAAVVAAASAAIGVGLAFWTCGHGRWPRLIGGVYLLPLLIPPYIHALAWTSIAGRRQLLDRALEWLMGPGHPPVSAYGFLATVVVMVLATFPIVTLLVRSGLQSIEPELLEAASLLRTPWPVARQIVAPLVAPHLVASAGIVFVLSLVEYGVPSLMQHNVYVMEVYATFSQEADAAMAFALSLALLVPAAGLLALTQWRLRSSPLQERSRSPMQLDSSSWPASVRALLLVCVSVWFVAAGAPLSILLARVEALGAVAAVASSAGRETALTVSLAVASGALTSVVAVSLASHLGRRGRGQRIAWMVCSLSLAVPAPVVGIAMIYLWNRPVLEWVYAGPAMLVLTHAARLLPFSLFAAAARVRHVDPLLLEAAELHSVAWWRRLLWVRLPLMAGALAMTWLVTFVLSLGELGASLLVAPPGQATLSMRIYNLLHYGASESVSALSLLVVLLAGAACLGMALVARVSRGGRS